MDLTANPTADLLQRLFFLQSAGFVHQLPSDAGHEVAFIGRSNAGKSSLLNTLTQRKNLARTSQKPGHTQTFNVYAAPQQPGRYLIDCPGYGYAKRSRVDRQRWDEVFETFVHERASLQGLVWIMDARHPFQTNDLDQFHRIIDTHHPIHLVFNKVDKVKQRDQQAFRAKADGFCAQHPDRLTWQFISAHHPKPSMLEQLLERLGAWLAPQGV